MIGKFIGKVFARLQRFYQLITPFSGPAPSLPTWLRLPNLHSFNFILLHYMYMIAMTLLCSILIYPAGEIPYIDALFFGAGSATQSGLNTIDVNKLSLYQQIVLVMIASLCNPIIINTFVVFVRLYWFEKRFQGVAKQAREFRRSRTRSLSKSEDIHDPDFLHEERGVGEREIKVLHSDAGHIVGDEMGGIAVEKESESSDSGPSSLIEQEGAEKARPTLDIIKGHGASQPTSTQSFPPFRRDVVFADELRDPSRDIHHHEKPTGVVEQDKHIAFVENQRNPKDSAALRIPGPRDVELGHAPQRVEGDPEDAITRPVSQEGEFTAQGGPSTSIAPDMELERLSARQRFRSQLNKLKHGGSIEHGDNPPDFHARMATRSRTFPTYLSHEKGMIDPMPYLSYAATIGRNSTFVDLTEDQREELGGIEYRSLKTLAWVLIAYYFGFFIFGIVILLPWIIRDKVHSQVVRDDGVTPVWWGFFTPMSMFTDLGFTLTPDSMLSFQTAILPLLLGTFLIIIGNTGFPCMLRFVIWVCSKCVPYGSGVWEEFRFLLDHPRRCFTLLFPQKATWWLLGVLVLLNTIDLVFFIILDLNDPAVTVLTPGFRFLDGLFQAASTRTAGFAVVNLAELHPGIQVSYLVMMYISVFPIAISVRRTNVYEEKSLGIYGGSNPDDEHLDTNSTSYLGSHLRRQLSFDLWYVFLGLFLICCIEGHRLQNTNDYAFTVFTVLFEIVSAYGTVGLSLGYPGVNASLSSQFRTLSKLIMIAMMLRGRHRGLPYALDRAILLPSESLQRKEAEMDERRRGRRASLLNIRDHHSSSDPTKPSEELDDPPTVGPRKTTVGQHLTRRNSSNTHDGTGDRHARSVSRSGHGLKRIFTGALGAGPSKIYKGA